MQVEQQQQAPGLQHPQLPVLQISAGRTHTCMSCQVPIAVHGRLVPCKHAFCLECATEMPKCVICCSNIQVVERVAQLLYISSLSQRTYFTEQELQLDTRQMMRRIANTPALAGAYQQYQQGRAAGSGVSPAAVNTMQQAQRKQQLQQYGTVQQQQQQQQQQHMQQQGMGQQQQQRQRQQQQQQ